MPSRSLSLEIFEAFIFDELFTFKSSLTVLFKRFQRHLYVARFGTFRRRKFLINIIVAGNYPFLSESNFRSFYYRTGRISECLCQLLFGPSLR